MEAQTKGFSRKVRPLLNADLSYRTLHLRLASETEAKSREQEFMRAKLAAAWLGVQQGILPSYKLGRHRLFRKGELLTVLGADRTAGRNEILR
jgi:hypothetical protein